MSYILDALKRAAQDKQAHELPDLHTPEVQKKAISSGRGIWPWLCGLLIIAGLAIMVVFHPWAVSEPAPESPRPTTSAITVQGAVTPAQWHIAERQPQALPTFAEPTPSVQSATTAVATTASNAAEQQAASRDDAGDAANEPEPQDDDDQPDPDLVKLFNQAVRDTAQAANIEKASAALKASQQRSQSANNNSKTSTDPSSDSNDGAADKVLDFRQHTRDNEANSKPSYNDVQPLAQLSQSFQDSIPHLKFQAHLYSSDDDKRWIRVNGHDHVEGDTIAPNVRLVAILPNKVILSSQGKMFTLSAMSDW